MVNRNTFLELKNYLERSYNVLSFLNLKKNGKIITIIKTDLSLLKSKKLP